MKVEEGISVYKLWQRLRESLRTSREVVLEFSAEDLPFGNLLTLKVLRNAAQNLGGGINFKGTNERAQTLVANLKGESQEVAEGSEPLGFREGIDVGKITSLTSFVASPRFRRATIFVILASLATLIIFLALLVLPKARVILVIDSESLVQSYEIIASPSAKVIDKEKRLIPAVLLDVLEQGEKSAPTTGKEEKGEKARGEVTIYNWTDEEQTFDAGTVLTFISIEAEKLRFLLEDAVTLPPQEASVSATPEERITTYKPGKKTVAVIAEEIGEKYNLEAQSQFSVAGLSTDDLLAQNEKSFSGGKKEEVQVVTAEDQRRLKARLEEELQRKAHEDLLSRTVGDQKLLDSAVFFDVLEEAYSHQADEETEEFSLTLKIKARGLLYSEETLNNLIAELLKENIPEDYNLSDEDLVTEVGAVTIERSEGSDHVALKIFAKVRSAVVPTIDQDKIKESILGITLIEAQKRLEALPNVASVRIELLPPLPGSLRRLPRIANRIEVVVKRR